VLTIADQFAKGDVHVWRDSTWRTSRRDERDTLARGRVASTRRERDDRAPPNYQLVAGGAEDPSAVEGRDCSVSPRRERTVKGADVIYTTPGSRWAWNRDDKRVGPLGLSGR